MTVALDDFGLRGYGCGRGDSNSNCYDGGCDGGGGKQQSTNDGSFQGGQRARRQVMNNTKSTRMADDEGSDKEDGKGDGNGDTIPSWG